MSSPRAPSGNGNGNGDGGGSAAPSYLAGMWTGLVRRFSWDEAEPGGRAEQPGPDTAQQRADDGIARVSPAAARRASPPGPPPVDPVVLHGYRDSTPASARLLTGAVAEEIRTMVPERLRIAEDWRLVYSLEQDGASLATLYQKCRPYDGRRAGFVLVVKDQQGATFGAYLSDHPHPAPSYFGNGECFLWRASPAPADSLRFRAFPYSGFNDCYINCEALFLSVGSGGGHYGLWLDDSLDVGHSSRCDTFGNEALSDAGDKFRVWGVELWVLGA